MYKNDIYYMESPRSSVKRLTDSGVEHKIFNGIPDWVYQGLWLSLSLLISQKTPEFSKGAIEIGLQVNHGIMAIVIHFHTISESFPKKMVQISVEKEGLALLYIWGPKKVTDAPLTHHQCILYIRRINGDQWVSWQSVDSRLTCWLICQ